MEIVHFLFARDSFTWISEKLINLSRPIIKCLMSSPILFIIYIVQYLLFNILFNIYKNTVNYSFITSQLQYSLWFCTAPLEGALALSHSLYDGHSFISNSLQRWFTVQKYIVVVFILMTVLMIVIIVEKWSAINADVINTKEQRVLLLW